MDVDVVEVIPEEKLSYQWDPVEPEPGVDPATLPRTLVTFTLEETAEGTLLRLVESGFDAVPLHLREKAFRNNDGGWTEQMTNIERHVTASR